MADTTIKPKFKRTRYWVAGKFQGKYVGLILLLTFLTATLCSYVVYYTSMILFGEKLASVYPQGRLVSIVNLINTRIIISILFVTPLITMIGVYLSHKIAGPIFRMERYINEMAMGNLQTRLILRKGDELMNLAEGINGLSEILKTTFINENTNLARISKELEILRSLMSSKHPDPSDINSSVDRLDMEIIALRREVERFKV